MLPVVFYLDLSQNNITKIESQAFEGLLQLQLLNLTENGLTEIPNGAFKGKFFYKPKIEGYSILYETNKFKTDLKKL